MSPAGHRIVEFGSFRLDLEAELLLRDGERVHLAPKSLALLSYMVGNSGRLVTRDELREHLWGDTVVDHEQGIGFLVRQVRQALGDDAAEPTYIETVPRRGFRFVADVAVPDTESKPGPSIRPWLLALLVLLAALVTVVVLPNRQEPVGVAVLLEGDSDGGEISRLEQTLERRLSAAEGLRLESDSAAAAMVVVLRGESHGDSAFVSARLTADGKEIWRGNAGGPAGRLEALQAAFADDIVELMMDLMQSSGPSGPGQITEVEKTVGESTP